MQWLHTEGNQVKDAFNRTVSLRGGNILRYMGEAGDTWKTVFDSVGQKSMHTPEWFDKYKALGVNAIRLNLAYRFLEPNVGTGEYDLNYLQMIDEVVSWCSQRNIRILLDCHGLEAGSCNFPVAWFDDVNNQQSWIQWWSFLVERYKNNPTVCIINLVNEMHWSETWEAEEGLTKYKQMCEKCIDALTAINPKLVFMVNGASEYWDIYHRGVPFIERPNVAFGAMLYYGYMVGEQEEFADMRPFIRQYMDGNFEAGKAGMYEWFDRDLLGGKDNAPIIISEIGIQYTAPNAQGHPNEEIFLKDFLQYCKDRHLSFMYYCLMTSSEDASEGFELYNPTTLEPWQPWGDILKNSLAQPAMEDDIRFLLLFFGIFLVLVLGFSMIGRKT